MEFVRTRQDQNTFNRRLSPTQVALGILVLMPLFIRAGAYISSAITKFLVLTLNLSVTTNEVLVYLNGVNDLLILIVCLLILWSFIKPQLKDAGKNLKHILVYGIIVSMIMVYTCNIISNLLLSLFADTTTSVNQSTVVSLAKVNPAIMFITAVILAPISEELIFRGFLFTWLRKHNRILAYVVSGFMFGFVHVLSTVLTGNFKELIQMIPYVMMGLVYCFIYEHENNITAPILGHMTNNLIAMVTIFIASI